MRETHAPVHLDLLVEMRIRAIGHLDRDPISGQRGPSDTGLVVKSGHQKNEIGARGSLPGIWDKVSAVPSADTRHTMREVDPWTNQARSCWHG